MAIDRLSQRIFLTTFMASEATTIAGENPVSLSRRASRAGLLTAGLIASLAQSACLPSGEAYAQEQGRPQTVPLLPEPAPSLRTFTEEEIAALKRLGWNDADINKAKEYQQEFKFDEITWLGWGEIPPEKSQDFLKSEDRFAAIKEEVKKQYDDRFDDEARNILIGRIEPRFANSYPNVLPAQIIVDLWNEKPQITPRALTRRWNEAALKHFVDTNTPIRKTLGYSNRWKAEDVVYLVRYGVPNNEADAYPEALDGVTVGILWENGVGGKLAEEGLARFSKENLLELAKSGETIQEGLRNFEEALNFPERFKMVQYILRILAKGYSADYVAKYDEKFPEHSVAFFVENGISAKEANANFPKGIGPSRFLAIRKKHKDFPPHVIDDYPKHYNAEDRYAAAMAGMGVGYAKAYPERFSGEDAVSLWKNRIFGEEASTYAAWLEAKQILSLKRSGITGPQTQKYLAGYPLEDIIAQERRKSR